MNDSDLDDRLRAALHDRHARTHESLELRTSVPAQSAPSPRLRPYTVLVPALAAVAVLAVLLGTGILNRAQDESTPAGPAPTLQIPTVEGPSQTRSESLRDDIYSVVADLPLKQRVGTVIAPAVHTSEGFWVLSSPAFPEPPATDKDGCLPRDRNVPIYDLCDLSEYSELLLLSGDGSRILRAFPQPGGVSVSHTMVASRWDPVTTASTWFTVTPDAVYCGNDTTGDPDYYTALCRVDRKSYGYEGLVLTCEPAEYRSQCPTRTDRTAIKSLLLPGEWGTGPMVKNVAGVAEDANGGMQIVDPNGTPRALLTTSPRLQVTSVLD